MYPRMCRLPNCFPSSVYIIRMGTSQATNYRGANFFSDKLYRLKVTGGANRKASLNNIHTKLLQLPGYL